MTQTATKTRKPVEIQAAVVFRCYAKEDTLKQHCIGYLVPSDQEGVDPYQVTFNHQAARYECNCKCGEETNHTVTCKHIRGVNSTVAARKEFSKQENITPTATPEQIAAVEEVKAERKMQAFKRGMDEQYASDPRVARYDEAAENRSAYLKMMESEY